MGCEGSPTFFNDYKAASIHDIRVTSRCHKFLLMIIIIPVTVMLGRKLTRNDRVVRYACMGCEGSPTFFNDYKAASIHYGRSKSCNQSKRGIKPVSVHVNPSPQYVGDGEAGGAGGGGPWLPQPMPARRSHPGDITHDIIKFAISQLCDIT
jgi:hypothetical protein